MLSLAHWLDEFEMQQRAPLGLGFLDAFEEVLVGADAYPGDYPCDHH
jgi:hypothetical protein